MVEFRADNGQRSIYRVWHTATAYSGHIINPINAAARKLEDDHASLAFARGVDEKGRPFIELTIAGSDPAAASHLLTPVLVEAYKHTGWQLVGMPHERGTDKLVYRVIHNRLSEVVAVLFNVTIHGGRNLVPEHYRAFVVEQQKVRHGLEQSLLNAFGEDMYARANPAMRKKAEFKNLPKSEMNRIARLVDYFRNGICDAQQGNQSQHA